MSKPKSSRRFARRSPQFAANYGEDYYLEKARAGEHTTELWNEAGKLGFIGVNMPEEYGGGGAGMYELSLVMEEMSAGGCGLLMMVVSPAINGTIISKFGTDEQKRRWLPGIADGSITMAFAITEPDAGSNCAQDHHHRAPRRQRLDPVGPEGLHLRRRPGAGGARRRPHGGSQDRQPQARAVRRAHRHPRLRGPRSTWISSARTTSSSSSSTRCGLPADALVGSEDAAIAQLFAGLNPERIMGAASAVGMGRFAIDKAIEYVKTRQVWKTPIGAHQGIAHPLAQNHIEIELAKLMMQKAATLYDVGDDGGAAEAANMAKYAAGEASVRAVDQAVQSPRRQRPDQGVRPRLGADRIAACAHRTGQPRDDPQLRRADLAGPAQVLLMGVH